MAASDTSQSPARRTASDAEWRIARLSDRTGADCSAARAIMVPSAICAVMAAVAAALAMRSSLDVRPLLGSYMLSAMAVSVLAVSVLAGDVADDRPE